MSRQMISRLALLLLAPVLASTAEPTAPAIDPDIVAFSQLPRLAGPKLSPDGSKFAGLMSSNSEQFFVIAPVDAQDGRPKSVSLSAGNDLEDWWWVNDEWLLIRVGGVSNVQGDDWRIDRAYGVHVSGKKFVPLGHRQAAQHGADVIWVAQDGTPRALIAMQQSIYSADEKFFPEVFEFDVSTGKMISRAKPRVDVMSWHADTNGDVRIGIGYNDAKNSSRLIYRDRNGELFRTIDRTDPGQAESLTVPALFLAETGKALAFSNHSGFNALYELDLKTLSLGKEVFAVPGYDIHGFVADAAGSALLGVTWTDTQARIQWLEPVMAKAQRVLDAALGPERRAHIVSMSRNQQRMLVWSGSPSTPGTYYLYDLENRKLAPIQDVQPALRDMTTAPVSSFRYKARDGLEIEAVLTLPAGATKDPLPLIMLPHGGPAARDEESWDWWAQYLAHLGYAVVQPNYRGSTGYGNEFEDKGTGQWGLAMQDDLLDAIDHLAKAGTIDPKRVCIAGASYGGYAALRAAQRDGGKYRCAISYAGVSDLVGMLKYDIDGFYSRSARRHWKGTAEDLRAVSPISTPESFSMPVLIMHGKADLRVPVKQSSAMAEKLRKAGKDVRYVEQPLGDHNFSRTEDRQEFLREMAAFLKQHNPL